LRHKQELIDYVYIGIIEELQRIKDSHGDIVCLIETFEDGVPHMMPVGELNIENRDGYGNSVSIII
jgi:hypothetical protein